ncbi:hypothetical protein Tco_0570328 [Tanacetum coccineum]
MYVSGRVDIFDMVDIDLFTVVALNMMVLKLGYCGKSEPMFYNYLKSLTSLDEGLYALACEEDVRFLCTFFRSFKLIESSETTKEPVCESVTPSSLPQHDSSTPCKDSICESITPRCMPDCILTPPTDESVITYTQYSGIHGVDTQSHVLPTIQSQFSDINLSFVSQQATASQVIDDVMRQLSFDETGLDGEAGFADVAGGGVDSSGLNVDRTQKPILSEVSTQEPIVTEVCNEVPIVEEVGTQDFSVEDVVVEDYFFYDDEGIDTAYETEYDVQYSKDAGTDDDDDVDEDFLVDEENEIVEPDVDVYLFGISMDLHFDNIGITNSVPDDVLEREDVDVINADGFDSDPGNDEEKNYKKRRLAELRTEIEGVINASGQWKYSFYTSQKFTTLKEAKDRVYMHSIESIRNLKLYKNDGVRIRARCDGKVPIFTMSQGTGPTGPNRRMEVGPNRSSGPTTKSKKGRIQIAEISPIRRLRMMTLLSLKNDMPLRDKLQEEKALSRGETFNWQTATYGKREYCDDEDDSFTNFETEFPAIVFDDITSNTSLSCESTISPLNDNEIDFRISFDESDDEDYTVIYDENLFSYKIISVSNLKMDSENDNDKVNMPLFPTPEPEVSYSNDLDSFKDFENEFPAIVYNDALTSKSDFLI